MKHVVRACFAGDQIDAQIPPHARASEDRRKMRAIPPQSAREVQIEIVNFLDQRTGDRWM